MSLPASLCLLTSTVFTTAEPVNSMSRGSEHASTGASCVSSLDTLRLGPQG